jgi:hypothetical protein
MPKTAQVVEERKAITQNTEKAKKLSGIARRLANLKPWPKGVSGNPGGRPTLDKASDIGREIFEEDHAAIKIAFKRALRKGNAYAFSVLADRAYGKLKEHQEIMHVHQHVEDKDLNERIKQIERDLGLAAQIDAAGRVAIAAAREGTQGEPKKDTPVLSGQRPVKA